ncbi:MAG: HXXEE domain-containing protein [Clostridiales bacterium]|nr:HXXEE domain-containing protein [Clostridiales bacterium]
MSDVRFIVWLFPIIFMFHDFEEIIFIKPWFERNRERVRERFPRVAKRLLPFTDALTTPSLSLGVAGMYVLVCAVTVSAQITGQYLVWFGVFFAFTVHLLVHCIPSFAFRGYVPAVATSVACLPVCSYMNVLFIQTYELGLNQAASFVAVGCVLMAATRLIMQIAMRKFDRWLYAYKNR